MKKKLLLLAFFSLALLVTPAVIPPIITAQETITAADADKYVGQKATVCGIVASATFSTRSKGQPTFLNLDQPYPRQIFTVVIWGKDREYFSSPPEIAYRGKRADTMKQLAVKVPEEVHRALKIKAAEEGKSVAVIVEGIIREYLIKGGRNG